jgi:hypothetical protein
MIIYPDLWKPPWWRFDQVNPPCCWGDGGRTAEMSRPRLQDGYHCHQASGRSEWPQRWEVTSKKSLIIELCYVYYIYMGMDQYLLIPFLVGWTSIYQLFWCSPGVQGFDTLPFNQRTIMIWRENWEETIGRSSHHRRLQFFSTPSTLCIPITVVYDSNPQKSHRSTSAQNSQQKTTRKVKSNPIIIENHQ